MSPHWKPEDYTSLAPYLVVRDAQAVMDFIVDALGGHGLRRFEGKDGSIMHAEVRIDDTVLMMGEAGSDWTPVPCHLHLYVPDVDATYRKALEHGAEPVEEPTRKKGDPDRRGGVKDPGGNTWWFSTQES